MSNDFLPQEYKMPDANSGYFKFKPGENRFRVLSSAIVGFESWIDDAKGGRKPRRWRMNVSIPAEDIGDEPKHFWAFVVWNYQEKKIQILEITQKGIMKSIQTLTKDEDWGSPKGYDIVVTREGEGLETEYQVQPKPKKELTEDVLKFYNKVSINLEALFDGEDPFKSENIVSEQDLDAIDEQK